MICPSCGNENRPNARFCAHCGTLLEGFPPQTPEIHPPKVRAESASPVTVNDLGDTNQMVGKVGLFGGHGLITFGALIVLFAFMLPWASCGNLQISGLDIATQPAQYEGSASWTFLLLVPLAALALLVLGLIGLAAGTLSKSLPDNLVRLVPILPLVAILPGMCGCCPSLAFLVNIQKARSDPSGIGILVKAEYGFWLTLIGLGLSLIGIVAATVGGLVAQRRTDESTSEVFPYG